MKITVLSSGPLSTIQDSGRFGYMSTGFSSNGAMDSYSMSLANLLVGNETGEGVVEMTFMGMSVSFDCDCVFALTGADMLPELNGQPISMYSAVQAKADDVLTMKMARSGMRAYLAVAGGFELDSVMGSVATNLKCGIGGINGKKLASYDELPLRRATRLLPDVDISLNEGLCCDNEITVRVMLGPQDDYFTDKGMQTFLSQTYKVSDKSDRMGIRLEGEPIENKNGVDIISDGIVEGSIQIPASGTPIIMMADRQTTGGYAKIATVITVDLPLVAQARPGTVIRFKRVDNKEAVKALQKRTKLLQKYKKKIKGN